MQTFSHITSPIPMIAETHPDRYNNHTFRYPHVMNFLISLLSILITLVSPIGVGGEKLAEQQIRKRVHQVEAIDIRIDNIPTYQIANGKIDKIRIASKGISPIADFRIDTLEIETDPIALKGLSTKLAKPLQAGIKVIMTEQDLNTALASPTVIKRLRNIGINALGSSSAANQIAKYDFLNPKVAFLGDRRVQLQVDLQEQGRPETLQLKIETDIAISQGRQIQLQNATITANNQAVYKPLANRIIAGVNQELDLARLEKSGMTARLLGLNFRDRQATIITFIQMRSR
jgi:hypothetical protein